MKTTLVDGLYRVTTAQLCAGFVVERGRVTLCAPILRKRLGYWLTQGVRVHADRVPRDIRVARGLL